MCLAHEALQDSGASPSSNGCPRREAAEGVCVASPVRNEKDGAPEIPEIVIPTTLGTPSSTHNRSYKYCWYKRSGGMLCSRFRRKSAKVVPEMTGDAEIDAIEAGSAAQQDDITEIEETTAPNSPASGCKQQEKTDQNKNAKPGGRSLFGRVLLLYSESLDKWPVVTKAISSGLIGALGDIAAQAIEWSFGDGPVPWSDRYVIWRTFAVMIDGFFVNGPLLHYAYELLENYMPAGESVFGAMMQVGVDVFVIDPIFAFIFVWSTGLVEGLSVEKDILHTLRYNFSSMVMWLIILGLCWAPLQTYLFNRYPVQFRVLVADFIDLIWTCVTSFFTHVRSS